MDYSVFLLPFSENRVIDGVELEGLEYVSILKKDENGEWQKIGTYADIGLDHSINKYYYENQYHAVTKTVVKSWDDLHEEEFKGWPDNSTIQMSMFGWREGKLPDPSPYGGVENYRAYQSHPFEIDGETQFDRNCRRATANHNEIMIDFGGGGYNMNGGYGRLLKSTVIIDCVKYPEAAGHIEEAQAPSLAKVLTLNRAGSSMGHQLKGLPDGTKVKLKTN